MTPREISLTNFLTQRVDRITSSKRKLDDYGPRDEDEFSDLISVRMKKSDSNSSEAALNSFSTTSQQDTDSEEEESRVSTSKSLHFFVRGGNTLVIHANSDDSVESVLEQIRCRTGIPIFEQRLIYKGKQLGPEQTLEQCSIENDAIVQLVGRMRSTLLPQTWQTVNELVWSSYLLGKNEPLPPGMNISLKIKEFLSLTPSENGMYDKVLWHFKIFKSTGAPNALAMLFFSPFEGNKEIADESIRLMLPPNLDLLPKPIRVHCASIVLEFCKSLSGSVDPNDSLYNACRSALGSLLDIIGLAHGNTYFNYATPSASIREFFPFLRELASKLVADLELSWTSTPCTDTTGTTVVDIVRDFAAFLHVVSWAIQDHVGGKLPIYLHNKHPCYMAEIESLYAILLELLEKINQCLLRVEGILSSKAAAGRTESYRIGWSQYIPVLKELNDICKLFEGAKDILSSVMYSRRIALNVLIRRLKRSERNDNHHWLLDHKDVTDFESRRHLVMMMFPEMVDEFEELHEMLIDRSQLLGESFEYIARAEPQSFRGGLFMEFKNEEATGPGVLREWFYLVCQAIFNPQNPLFLACPNDQRRFFPNPASKVDALHLDYFGFCGRMIALALMNKVHVGIVLDRVFYLQLAGKSVSLEDARDADPCLYMSCKKILEMDAEFLDSDALGLTFVREIEELGCRKVVELVPEGKNIVVNSENREEYVKLLIQHRFVTSIKGQVSRFAQGFADILSHPRFQKSFFRSLELEDLDRMLHGNDNAICVNDWKAHTDYHGYKGTDRQICWFWKVVEGMSTEQQRSLLFFWTSVKYLPVEGFRGLSSRLQIYKALDSQTRLPSSHTCFYRLCIPPYSSMGCMRDSLHFVAQEHVSCSFGTW